MDIILPGRQFDFIMLLLMCLLIFVSIKLSRSGKVPTMRKLPALDALEEAAGRAAEMGKPIFFSTGLGGLDSDSAGTSLAGLSVLGYTAEMAGKYGADMMYLSAKAHMIPLALDLLKGGYLKGGRPEMFKTDMVQYVSESQQAYRGYAQGWIMQNNPAAVLMFGALSGEAMNVFATGTRTGAMQIAGTPSIFYQPIMSLVCDYSLLGEELFVGGAVLSKDKAQLGQLRGMDWVKFLVIGLLVASSLLVNMGINYQKLVGF